MEDSAFPIQRAPTPTSPAAPQPAPDQNTSIEAPNAQDLVKKILEIAQQFHRKIHSAAGKFLKDIAGKKFDERFEALMGQKKGDSGVEVKRWVCNAELPWTVEEFFDKAVALRHSLANHAVIPGRTNEDIMAVLTKGLEEWARNVRAVCKPLAEQAQAFAVSGRDLKARLPEKTRRVNNRKQILLTRKLLGKTRYPDADVTFRCLHGFPLVGEMDATGVFEQRPVEHANEGADPTWLAKNARIRRGAIAAEMAGQPVDDVARQVYDLTVNPEYGEPAMGWAAGPFSEAEMSERLGHDLWVPCRMLGATQGDKVRQIDDLSEKDHERLQHVPRKSRSGRGGRHSEHRQILGGRHPTRSGAPVSRILGDHGFRASAVLPIA